MSSTLHRKSQKIAFDLLERTRQRIGIRYIIFSDQWHPPHCAAFLFGVLPATTTLFWLESPTLTSFTGGRVTFNLYDNDQAGKLAEKFSEWENKGMTHPWWGELVSPQMFKCVSVINTNKSLTTELGELRHELYFFHGLLAARLNAHLTDLKDMVTKDLLLKSRADAFEVAVRRFRGFADDAYHKEFWKKH